MRNLWFYIMILAIWVLIISSSMGIWQRLQEKEVVVHSYYDWQALVDDEFRCVDEIEIEKVFTYEELALFMEQVSDGMFKEVKIRKDENVQISLKMYMTGKYFEELKDSYPEMDWMFGMIQGLDMEIGCIPSFQDSFLLNIQSAKVGMIELPIALFTILEEELQEIFDGVYPLEIYEYRFQDDGLYVFGIVPMRIERNT